MIIKNNVFYALPLFQNLKNQDSWNKIYQIAAISILSYDF